MKNLDLIKKVVQLADEKQAKNIVAVDVSASSTVTDAIVVCEANVNRHAMAIAHEIIEKLKESKVRPQQTEGLSDGQWIVIDYIDLIVHIFTPGLREKYAVERVWPDAKIIDLDATSPDLP